MAQDVLRRPDHPTILEQIDAVQWAELQLASLAKLARLGMRPICLPGRHTPGLTRKQIDALNCRLEAAVETLRTLEFGSQTAR